MIVGKKAMVALLAMACGMSMHAAEDRKNSEDGIRDSEAKKTPGVQFSMGATLGPSCQPSSSSCAALDVATRAEAEATLARGVAWLQAQQAADGRIGSNAHVAVTALALSAMRGAGERGMQRKYSVFSVQNSEEGAKTAAQNSAEKFLREFLATNPTNAGFAVLNAEVCRKILHLPDDGGQAQDWASALARIDRDDSARAREFEFREIAWQKQRAELVRQGRDPEQFAAESLARAVVPTSGAMPEISPRDGTRGPPGSPVPEMSPRGGTRGPPDAQTAKEPRRVRRGYGSLTYEGMMRLLYDDPKGNDPRVDAMMDWAERGWSLDENPGKGKAGFYFFLNGMVKCLDASGEEAITPMFGGAPIRWREEFVRKLVALQHVDKEKQTGYWVNENKSYMEDDPVLVTAYAMLALERALGKEQLAVNSEQ